jgi:hypothetical protein
VDQQNSFITQTRSKVSSDDDTPAFLEDKLTVASPITITVNNPGGNETVQFGLDQSGIDHGSIGGLGDDDHTHYTLADGTRSFTGAVGGVTPTLGVHLTTKDYVDSLTQGISWQEPVIDGDLSTPPVSPNTGDRYIVFPTGTGAWAGQDNNIAEWNGSSWDFTTSTEGFAVWEEDDNRQLVFNGTAWVKLSSTINHLSLQNIGVNTHVQIDSHIADSSIHFTEGSIDHGSISGLGDDDHTQYLLTAGS